MTEVALTVVRKTPSSKNKTKGSVVGPIRHYTADFKKKYGNLNGVPTNVFHNYEPPSARQRLHDANRQELRCNAEKAVYLCEYVIDLFTLEKDTIFDMFAGTASMAVACIKTKRKYLGVDKDAEVCKWAMQRIGRCWQAQTRGEFETTEAKTAPGLSRSLNEQVFFVVFFFFFFFGMV
jgi:DNA modification methylase